MTEPKQTDQRLAAVFRENDEPQTGLMGLIARAKSAGSIVADAMRDIGYALNEALPSSKLNISFTDMSAPASKKTWLAKAHTNSDAATNAHAGRIETATELKEGSEAAMERATGIVNSGGKVVPFGRKL